MSRRIPPGNWCGLRVAKNFVEKFRGNYLQCLANNLPEPGVVRDYLAEAPQTPPSNPPRPPLLKGRFGIETGSNRCRIDVESMSNRCGIDPGVISTVLWQGMSEAKDQLLTHRKHERGPSHQRCEECLLVRA